MLLGPRAVVPAVGEAEAKRRQQALLDILADDGLTADRISDRLDEAGIPHVCGTMMWQELSPVGLAHLYRQLYFDAGAGVGPIEQVVGIAPNEVLDIVQEVSRRRTVETIEEIGMSQSYESETSREFLSVKKFEVAISILALLQGELVLSDVEWVGATLHLQRGDNQDTTWSFRRSAKPKSPSDRMLDIVALHAKDILIVYYPADRPAVSVRIDELHASLEQDEPIELQLKGAIRELPVDIALQGGTLAQLLDVNQQWRFRGQLDTDFRKIDFAGHITDLFRLHGMELRVSSDIQQQHWVKFLGRSIEPLVDRYHAHLSVITMPVFIKQN